MEFYLVDRKHAILDKEVANVKITLLGNSSLHKSQFEDELVVKEACVLVGYIPISINGVDTKLIPTLIDYVKENYDYSKTFKSKDDFFNFLNKVKQAYYDNSDESFEITYTFAKILATFDSIKFAIKIYPNVSSSNGYHISYMRFSDYYIDIIEKFSEKFKKSEHLTSIDVSIDSYYKSDITGRLYCEIQEAHEEMRGE